MSVHVKILRKQVPRAAARGDDIVRELIRLCRANSNGSRIRVARPLRTIALEVRSPDLVIALNALRDDFLPGAFNVLAAIAASRVLDREPGGP